MCNTDDVIKCRKCATQMKSSYGREARNDQSNRCIESFIISCFPHFICDYFHMFNCGLCQSQMNTALVDTQNIKNGDPCFLRDKL